MQLPTKVYFYRNLLYFSCELTTAHGREQFARDGNFKDILRHFVGEFADKPSALYAITLYDFIQDPSVFNLGTR
jgi:hypothetical protein